MKKFVILAICIALLSILYISKKQLTCHPELPDSLTLNQYLVNSHPVTIAHQQLLPNDDGIELEIPRIFIDGRCPTYRVKFDGESGDQGVSLHQAYSQDTDQDDQDELVTEWLLNWGGSGGYKAIIVWEVGDQLTPAFGLPPAPATRNVIVSIANDTQIFSAPATDMYAFTYIDSDTQKLFFALPQYDWTIPHFDPQAWELSIFKLENSRYVVDEAWNHGEPLLTIDRLSIDDPELKTKILPLFYNKKAQYPGRKAE